MITVVCFFSVWPFVRTVKKKPHKYEIFPVATDWCVLFCFFPKAGFYFLNEPFHPEQKLVYVTVISEEMQAKSRTDFSWLSWSVHIRPAFLSSSPHWPWFHLSPEQRTLQNNVARFDK